MKQAIKEMLLFSIVVNAVGGILMLLAEFALPQLISGDVEAILTFGWPIVAVIAYIVFERKLDIDVTYSFLKSFFIYLINLTVWMVFTLLFQKLTMWIAVNGPWFTEERKHDWYLSHSGFGGTYEWMFGLMGAVMPYVFLICFVVRTVRNMKRR